MRPFHKTLLAGFCLSVTFYIGYLFGISACDYGSCGSSAKLCAQCPIQPRVTSEFNDYVTKQLLVAIRRLVAGYRHIRSSKAAVELRNAFDLLYSTLKYLNDAESQRINRTLEIELLKNPSRGRNTTQFQGSDLPDVCPERWVDMLHGFPYYFTGFDHVNCTPSAPFKDIVTIALQFRYGTFTDINETLAGIQTVYPGVKVVISVFDELTLAAIKKQAYGSLRLTVLPGDRNIADGAVIRSLVEKVDTKYVLLSPDKLIRLDWYSKLDRLLRMVNYFPTVDLAGGSYRNYSGHWTYGCYQTIMRNYHYRMVEGYDLSVQSCPYCDYISGPFVTTTEQVKKVGFSDFWGNFAFLDFFERWKKAGLNAVVCPDSMFHKAGDHYPFENTDRSTFVPFAARWELNKIQLRRTTNILRFSCSELGQKCRTDKGLSVPPCCLDTIPEMLAFTFDALAEAGIDAEVEAGTALGSVKMRGTLPWELDADYNYRSSEGCHSKFGSLAAKFSKAGYSVKEERKCDENKLSRAKFENCGYYAVRNGYWRFESWGVSRLGQDYMIDEGVPNPTLVEIDGKWYRSYPNPALFVRNMYGDDIFEHVEHWSKLGYDTGWKPYVTGSFGKCPIPNFHACLDNYLPVGNLQFMEVWL